MAYTVWGWSEGRLRRRRVHQHHADAAVRPLDMLGWVYRSIRQGLIDMEAMFELIDTPAEIVGQTGAAALVVP